MSEGRKENEPTPNTPSDEWVTLPQAAKLLGRHRQTVLVIAARGELTLDQRAGITFVSRASIDAYLARKSAEASPVALTA